jgi:hypothetical protein
MYTKRLFSMTMHPRYTTLLRYTTYFVFQYVDVKYCVYL